jgi:hypothetical protein
MMLTNKEIIKWLQSLKSEIGKQSNQNLWHYEEALDMIIKALQEDEWIPVSERLPSAEDCPMDCMVTRKSKFVGNYVDMAVAEANGTWTHEDWKAITLDGKATCISTRDADILAWMPLTEPYKGGEDE